MELSDDAAFVNLGESYRIPTNSEWKELFENSSVEWTSNYNDTGITGYILRSIVTGYTDKYVFLPCAGYYWGYQGSVGQYIVADRIGCGPTATDTMYFTSDAIYGCGYLDYASTSSAKDGNTVRAVFVE